MTPTVHPMTDEREKQYVVVWDAVRAGCETSREIADETGMPLKTVSAWLSELERDGAIVRIGWTKYRMEDGRIHGPKSYRYSADDRLVAQEMVKRLRERMAVLDD